jgi:cytochrome c553
MAVKKLLAVSMLFAAAQSVHAADIEAGRQLANAVCAACHGANGISVAATIPNLAGQHAPYLEAQIKAFKDGTRKQPGLVNQTAIMSAIATQLSPEDAANAAAYFAAQPGPPAGAAMSAQLPNVAKTHVTFPEGYEKSFTKYHTINFPAAKEVRYYYANQAAVAAAKAGKPLPDGSVLFAEVYSVKLDASNNPVTGTDGFFQPDKLLRYTAMERETGWGSEIPELLRNENWNYAVFTKDKQLQAGVNQALCFACHKPLSNVSYTFTLKQLTEAK